MTSKQDIQDFFEDTQQGKVIEMETHHEKPMQSVAKPKLGKLCAIHGLVEQVITSTIPGHEGQWCLLCQLNWYNNNLEKVQIVEIREQPIAEKSE